jgi:hypothetical protein
MKRFRSALLCIAMVAVCSVQAFAGWLPGRTGTMPNGFFMSISPTNGAMDGPLTVSTFKTIDALATGSFAGIDVLNDVAFDDSENFDAFGQVVGDAFNFSSADFGTFVGSIDGESSTGTLSDATGAATRQLSFTGTFTPGSNSHFGGDTTLLTNVSLQITFSRTTGGTVSASWSMDTSFSAPVPEPTSMAIFGLGAVGFVARRFRRK